MRHVLMLFAVASGLLSTSVAGVMAGELFGRDPYGRAAVPGLGWTCGLDHARFCPGVPISDRAVLVCLSARHDELMPRCLRHLRVAATIEACDGDFRRYCAGVLPGAGRGLSCLAGNRDRLSRPCDRALASIAPGWHAAERPRRPQSRSRDPGEDWSEDRLEGYEPPDLSEAPIK